MKSSVWRVVALSPWDGGDLSINALHLYSAESRVDTAAVLSSSHAPVSGQLADISQTMPAAAVVFAATSVEASGFYVQWAFPVEEEITALRIAGCDLSSFAVFAFAGGVWTLVRAVRALRGLSATALTPLLKFCVREPQLQSVACMAGDTAQDAVTGGVWNLSAGASLQSGINRGGVQMLRVQGSASVNLASMVPSFTNWTGADITIEAAIFNEAPPTGDGSYLPLAVFCGEASPGIVYWSFGPSSDDSLAFYYWSGTQNLFRTPPRCIKRNQLMYVAISIQGPTLRFFVDGKLVHTATRSTTPVGGGNAWPLRIGCTDGAQARAGYFAVSDVIFTPSAKYTADYSVAERWDTEPRTLTQNLSTAIGASSEIPAFEVLGDGASMACDVEFGGEGRIYGTVARKATPANTKLSRRVRLHRSVDGYLARETWSKADGSYDFRELNPRYEYDVIAWDHELQEFAAVANNQRAEVMS